MKYRNNGYIPVFNKTQINDVSKKFDPQSKELVIIIFCFRQERIHIQEIIMDIV